MRNRGRTALGTALAAVLAMGLLAGAAAAQNDTTGEGVVTAAVQVTQNPDASRAHATPVIDVNPTNGELTIFETEFRTTMECGVHLSANDGRTWQRAGDPTMEPYTDCGSDPTSTQNQWMTYADDGTLYLAFIAHDPEFNDRGRGDLPRSVFLARSDDSGRSFDTTMVFEAPEEIDEDSGANTNRRARVAVDPNDSSRVYVSWQQSGDDGGPAKGLIAASDDGGETFADAVNVADSRGAYHPRISVDGDGTVHTAISTLGQPADEDDDRLPRAVDYRQSTDGGQTWSDPVELHEGHMGFGLGRKWEVKADPNSSAVYAYWYGALDPDTDATETPRDVFVRTSHDSGETWEEAVQVNDNEGGAEPVQQYDPLVDIAPNGRLDIAWFDFRNSPYPEGPVGEEGSNEGGFQDVYYAASDDQGATFAPNRRISDRSINREIGVWSNNAHIHGHVGVASTDDTVYFAWQDTRNGDPANQAEDVYFASLRLAPDDAGSPIAAVIAPGMPLWAIVGAALLVGMGIALLGAGLKMRGMARPQ